MVGRSAKDAADVLQVLGKTMGKGLKCITKEGLMIFRLNFLAGTLNFKTKSFGTWKTC